MLPIRTLTFDSRFPYDRARSSPSPSPRPLQILLLAFSPLPMTAPSEFSLFHPPSTLCFRWKTGVYRQRSQRTTRTRQRYCGDTMERCGGASGLKGERGLSVWARCVLFPLDLCVLLPCIALAYGRANASPCRTPPSASGLALPTRPHRQLRLRRLPPLHRLHTPSTPTSPLSRLATTVGRYGRSAPSRSLPLLRKPHSKGC